MVIVNVIDPFLNSLWPEFSSSLVVKWDVGLVRVGIVSVDVEWYFSVWPVEELPRSISYWDS